MKTFAFVGDGVVEVVSARNSESAWEKLFKYFERVSWEQRKDYDPPLTRAQCKENAEAALDRLTIEEVELIK